MRPIIYNGTSVLLSDLSDYREWQFTTLSNVIVDSRFHPMPHLGVFAYSLSASPTTHRAPPLFSPKKKWTKKPQRLSPIVASRQSGIERYFQQLPNVRQHDVSPPGIFRHVNKSIQAREDFLCWAIGNLHAHLINYTSTLNWLTH